MQRGSKRRRDGGREGEEGGGGGREGEGGREGGGREGGGREGGGRRKGGREGRERIFLIVYLLNAIRKLMHVSLDTGYAEPLRVEQ